MYRLISSIGVGVFWLLFVAVFTVHWSMILPCFALGYALDDYWKRNNWK